MDITPFGGKGLTTPELMANWIDVQTYVQMVMIQRIAEELVVAKIQGEDLEVLQNQEQLEGILFTHPQELNVKIREC
ncbi:hypothetical protein Tco_1035739 [Tanacetum coccineum]